MLKRSAEYVEISNICPSCERRLWLKNEDRKRRRRYGTPRWFRELFSSIIGVYPLGSYRVQKCEVCRKTVAIFDDNRGIFKDDVIVLYGCTLLSQPLDTEVCKAQLSCYGCKAKDNPLNVEKV